MEDNINNVTENQGKLGRLRYVTRTKKAYTCRECGNEIKVKFPCFTQSDYTNDAFFPEQTRLCVNCGLIQVKEGVLIKNKELFNKKNV